MNWRNRLSDNSSSSYSTNTIDVSEYIGDSIMLKIKKVDVSVSTRGFGFCDSNDIISTAYNYMIEKEEDDDYYIYTLPITDTHFFFSQRDDYQGELYIEVDALKKRIDEYYGTSDTTDKSTETVYYVSPTGSDENDGSSKHPLATVNKALEMGANSIYLYGGVYQQIIDLNKCNHQSLSINRFEIDKEVTFVDVERVLCNKETRIENYTKVYKAEIAKTLNASNVWLFQDSIADSSTLISDAERHPLQRGYEYRCSDAKIKKCEATTLNDALREIEDSREYKWYTENGLLYFSRPSNVNSDNPICASFGKNLFAIKDGITLKMNGINTKYLIFNINKTIDSEIIDCKATNVFGGGAFIYNSALNCKFIRCEASRCCRGVNGDGFNGHASNTGDIFSKQITATFIDCWSHDNNDDGYSDHERSETTIIGGLYEYNGKAGVTPSYGSHCTCYNVLSRNNYNGFYYTGTATEDEGGTYGQLICYNCVAENNKVGSHKSGFVVDGTGNSLMLVNCKSINNGVGYNSRAGNVVTLIDCGSHGDDTVRRGSGFDIKNTTLVE